MVNPVTFSGAASGLDTQGIVEALLSNRKNRVAGISGRISSANQQKSALSDLKSTLSSLKSAAEGLSSGAFGSRSTSLSDDTYFKATASEGSALGSYDVVVDSIARNSVATVGKAVALTDSLVTSGTATLDLDLQDGGTHSLSFGVGTTLNEIKDAINNDATINEDLEATLIQSEEGKYQLVVTSQEKGADQTIVGTSAMSGFDATSYSNDITTTIDGSDAHFFVNGIEVTRTTNEVSDVIDGVSLSLLKGEGVGTSNPGDYSTNETLKIDTDYDKIADGVQGFVNKFNDARNKLGALSNSGGLMSGDASLRGLKNELASIATGFVPHTDVLNARDGGTSDGYVSLSQIGFKTDSKTGTLSFDRSDFKEALEDHYDEVSNLFNGSTTSSNSDISLLTNTGRSFSGTIDLDLTEGSRKATIDGTEYGILEEGSGFKLDVDDDHALSGLVFYSETGDGTATLEIGSGMGAILGDSLGDYTEYSGVISDRTESLTNMVSRLNDDLDNAKLKLEDERTRLTRVFARSEQAISQLQGLQASLSGQLG